MRSRGAVPSLHSVRCQRQSAQRKAPEPRVRQATARRGRHGCSRTAATARHSATRDVRVGKFSSADRAEIDFISAPRAVGLHHRAKLFYVPRRTAHRRRHVQPRQPPLPRPLSPPPLRLTVRSPRHSLVWPTLLSRYIGAASPADKYLATIRAASNRLDSRPTMRITPSIRKATCSSPRNRRSATV